MKKADLHIKDFQLGGIRSVILDVTLRSEFHGACSDPARNGEASYVDPNSYDGNPRVGMRTGARHEDGRYTDMIWFRSTRSPRDAGGFNEPNKTVVK